MAQSGLNFIALICCVLATACGLVAVATDSWSTNETLGLETRVSPFRVTSVTDSDDIEINTDFEDSLDTLNDCDGIAAFGNCDAYRSVAATAILGVLFSAIGAVFSLIGICSEKQAVSNIVRFVTGLAFACFAVAAIVWVAVIHPDLNQENLGIQLISFDLGYSWGVLIPAAFFNICTGFATQ